MILPESWIEVSIGQVCDIYGGGTPDRSNLSYFSGGIPWATPTDVTKLDNLYLSNTSETLTEEGLKNSSAKLLPVGSVLLTSRATIGRTAIIEKPTCTNQGFVNLVCNSDVISNEYLARLLHSWTSYLESRATGATFKEISRSTIAKINIPLPTLSEQQQIVEIFQNIETFSINRNLFRERLERTKKQLFYEMFGNPNPLVNRQWSTEIIGKNIDVGTGGTPSRETETNYDGSIPWVKSTDLTDTVITETGEYLTEQGLKNSNAKIYPQYTILLAMYGQGQTRGRTGKLAIEAACNQACAALVPNERLNADYLWVWLQNSYDYVRSLGRGGQQANLNLSIIKNIKIPVPPIELQDKFSERLTQILKIENDMNEAIRKSAVLYEQVRVQALSGVLTETWRIKNQTQIKAEVEARAERLALTAKPRTPEKPPAAAKKSNPAQSRPARLALFSELSEFQRFVFDALHEWPARILIPDDSAAFEDFCRQWPVEHERNTQDRARRALDQLAALGLIAKISLPNPQGQYLTAYRMLREGDERRTGDIAAIGRLLEPA
jgi:type I restriction enzyme S subunit